MSQLHQLDGKAKKYPEKSAVLSNYMTPVTDRVKV